ncbi:MAG: ABC transporter substrate-binding protein [Ardenticatenaceae bacterium]|nr:ABC transporter substrate-binding protein [Ardenticatenaceae bacterium]
MASFGYWVRRRRKALDLTQAALARKVGCAPVTVKKIERDERRPSRQMAERLVVCLAIPAEERDRFIQSALGERPVDQLPPSTEPPRPLLRAHGLPTFLEVGEPPPVGPDSGFVGREDELAQLEAHLGRALDGQGGVVFVTGEVGRGKTALLAEFARRAQAAHADIIAAAGTCNAFMGAGDPYLPFRDVLGMLTGDVAPQVAAGTITREHARRLWHLVPHTVQALVEEGPDLLDVFVSRAALIRRAATAGSGGTEELRRLKELVARATGESGGLEQRQLLEQYRRVLQRVASQHPLLLLLDDLQWADAASINLLFHLGRRLSGSRILVLGAYRPSDISVGQLWSGAGHEQAHPLRPVVAELTRYSGDIQVNLDQIAAEEARRFVDAILDREPNRLGEQFRKALLRHTAGHALFTVELLRDMQERGALIQDPEGRWIEGETLDWEVLPARVEAVIRQRVDRLEEELRDILTAASVEGETFTAQIVAAVQHTEEQRVLRRLSRDLHQRHRLVREREEVDAAGRRLSRYQFNHVLFQHYLYQELSPGERRVLHGAVGAALEQLYEGRTDEIAAQLARHYTEAGEGARAVDYLLRAGDWARTLYAHQEAIDHYRWALSFLHQQGDPERAARTLVKLGLTYQIAFDFERARQAYDEGFALWQQAGGIRPATPPFPAPHPMRVDWRDPLTLDPTRAGNFWSAGIIGQLFSGLVELSPESDIVPDVAQTWEVLEGGRKYVFHLRDDVYWSDGTPVTAEDFEFAWKRALRTSGSSLASLLLHDVRGVSASYQGSITDPDQVGVCALNEATLAVELEEPTAHFPHVLAHPATYPVPKHVVEARGEIWANPETIVTNGPFTLESWQPGARMVFSRNPAYQGRFTGNLQRVELHLLTDPVRKLAMYEANELDVFRVWFLPAAELDRARQRHAEEYVSGPQITTLYVGFDASRPPFADRRVRRALVLATDREMHANVVHRGHFGPATGGFVPPGMPGHSPGIALPYDLDRAQQLLAEAGYPRGRGFPRVTLLVSDFRAQESEHLVAQWREHLGVEVKREIIETAISGEILREAQPSLFFNGWAADYSDPDSFLRVCVLSTLPGWRNEAYEQFVAEARRVTDQGKRMHLYRQADRILVEEAAIMPLTYPRVHLLVQPWMKRYPVSAMKAWFWKDVVLEQH